VLDRALEALMNVVLVLMILSPIWITALYWLQ
jgi:hypothetical protein